MNALISVIVPVYKVEKYLRRCIDSILAQTYNNIELILVDDGSPDKCPEICDEYVKKDNRIRVIHKKNGGLSSARNAGLDIAKGEYIGFVDSDDFIAPDMYKKLLKALIKSNADFAECNYCKVDEKGNEIGTKSHNYLKDETVTPDKIIEQKSYVRIDMAWNKLYRNMIFDDLRYPEGRFCEDAFVAPKLFHNRTVVCISDSLYYYTIRSDSITGLFSFKRFKDGQKAYMNAIRFYIENGYPNNYVLEKMYDSLWLLGNYSNNCSHSKTSEGKVYYKETLLSLRSMMHGISLKGLTLGKKLKLYIIIVSPKYAFKASYMLGRSNVR